MAYPPGGMNAFSDPLPIIQHVGPHIEALQKFYLAVSFYLSVLGDTHSTNYNTNRTFTILLAWFQPQNVRSSQLHALNALIYTIAI